VPWQAYDASVTSVLDPIAQERDGRRGAGPSEQVVLIAENHNAFD
jgi:hypothetical protein